MPPPVGPSLRGSDGSSETADGAEPGLRTWVAVLGSTVSIDADRPAWAARLGELLAPFAVGAPRPVGAVTVALSVRAGRDGDEVVLVRDGAELARGSWAAVEARLLVEVNATAIASYDGLAVHAGVVARGGEAVCFPGESGRGKSTITAACLAAGFDYVSDEALCIDRATATVVPYPRPIALSRASLALLGLEPGAGPAPAPGDDRAERSTGPPIPRTADALAAGAGTGSAEQDREVVVLAEALGSRAVAPDRRLRLAHVVELRRGATVLHLEPLHRAHAIPALLSMSFNHFKEPSSSVEVVGALARDVRVWRLHHDDPLEAAALLARTFP